MHRIMADLMSKDYEIVTRPSEENYTMHIPEGDEDNHSYCSFHGVSTRLYHDQQMTAKVVTSGPLIKTNEYNLGNPFTLPQGAKFTIEPSYLKRYHDTDCVDSFNPLGAELAFSVGRWRYLKEATNGATFYKATHMKACKLSRSHEANVLYGYIAMAVWVESYDVDNKIFFSLMNNKRKTTALPGTAGADWPYTWGVPFESADLQTDTALTAHTANFPVAADIAEFDDGSIFLVITTVTGLRCYRSVNYGVNWTFCGFSTLALFDSDVTAHSVALERINERLVAMVRFVKNTAVGYGVLNYSDDFGFTWDSNADFNFDEVDQESVACVDLAYGRDGVLYAAMTRDDPASAADTAVIKFTRSTDGVNWDIWYASDIKSDSFGLIEDHAGCWMVYFLNHDVGGTAEKEIAVCFNSITPIRTDVWDYSEKKLLTSNSVYIGAGATDVAWNSVCACPIDNHMFIDVLVASYDEAHDTEFKSIVSEFKCAVWSGLTCGEYTNVKTMDAVWDHTWFAYCYPSSSDTDPKIQQWTRETATGNAYLYKLDNTRHCYLAFANTVPGTTWTYSKGIANKLLTGIEAKFSIQIGTYSTKFTIDMSDGAGAYVSCEIRFNLTSNFVSLYDNYKAGGAGTLDSCTPVAWTLGEWNTFHFVLKGTSFQMFRSTDQFEEFQNFELILEGTLGTGAVAVPELFVWGETSSPGKMNIEYMLMNTTGVQWSMPIDQDTDLMGRKMYYYPCGLYSGMSVKCDGTYAVADDTWTIETGAVHEVENIFLPSPSVPWKSSYFKSTAVYGTEPDEVIVWKHKDDDAGNNVRQTVSGFAVFGRNWPYCKLEGSNDGSSFTTLFDSKASPNLAYILKLDASGASVENRVTVATPAGLPTLHTNRFASTPEITYYLMPTSGTAAYKIYKILENDADSFYLEENVNGTIANDEDLIIFSDRFYYDFSVMTNRVTTITRVQYEYFRLTIYGSVVIAGPTTKYIQFPLSDNRLKMIGSVHLGRVYDLPNEEWNIAMSLVPAMVVTESRSSRKEFRRLGKARRNMTLSYTGVIENGLGVNPVVDLNRSLGWGENPLVFIDDAEILSYGDVSPATYGTYTHPLPFLMRMIDGYALTRMALTYGTENNGNESMDLIRSIVDITGIQLEEII